jgi:hypothetical protein
LIERQRTTRPAALLSAFALSFGGPVALRPILSDGLPFTSYCSIHHRGTESTEFNKIIIIIDYQHIILRSDETRIVTTEMPDRMIFYTLDYTYLYREKLYFLALSPAFD